MEPAPPTPHYWPPVPGPVYRSRSRTGALQPSDEVELVSRVAGGDGRALAELYDRYSPLLLACARRVLGRQSDAEEVLQEVFLQVWNLAGRYEPGRSSVSTWLVLLTRSRSIDRLRSERSAERVRAGARQEQAVHGSETPAEGSARVLRVERRRRLHTALADLPDEQREVLDLAYYAGLTQSEISRRTGVPLGTVKTRTLLAMRKLRRSLAAEIEELL